MKKSLFAFLSALGLTASAFAETPRPVSLTTDFDPFITAAASSEELTLVDVALSQATNNGKSPWSVALTQTTDYGTSLALPIGLTPANTLLAPAGNPGAAGILNGPQAANLGLLGNLGIAPVPPGAAPVGVFEDDFQFQSTAAAQYQRQVGEFGTFTAAYTYYQSLHPDVKQVDLMSHTPSVNYAVKLTERITTATYYNYQYYFLSGSSFLTQNRIGSVTTFRANDLWDWNLGTNYSNVNFRRGADFLDSDNYAGTLEAVRYLDSERNDYLKVGYGTGYSDAELRGFSYQLQSLNVTYRELFGASNRHEVRMSGGYSFFDFIGPDPLQPAIFRADNIWTAGLFYGRKISDNVQLFGSYTYLNSNSNVARQLYNSDLASFGLTYAR